MIGHSSILDLEDRYSKSLQEMLGHLSSIALESLTYDLVGIQAYRPILQAC